MVETVAAVGVVALLSVLAPIVVEAQARRVDGQAISEQNQRLIAGGAAMFAADNMNAIVSFSWRAGEANSQWDDLNFAQDDLQAAADQAVDTIRRLGGLGPEDAPPVRFWIPHVYYTHLVLADYLNLALPDSLFINPEDSARTCWTSGPTLKRPWWEACDAPSRAPETRYRWVFSSSYQFVSASYSDDSGPRAIYQVGQHNRYVIPGEAPLGGRSMDEVAFPGQKVFLHDSHARHSGPAQLFYGYKEAEQPIAFFDGSVRTVLTMDANEGFFPRIPTDDAPHRFFYVPANWEPPTMSGGERDQVAGWYAYCRGGLLGVDVGGPEINTGNPGIDDDHDGY